MVPFFCLKKLRNHGVGKTKALIKFFEEKGNKQIANHYRRKLHKELNENNAEDLSL